MNRPKLQIIEFLGTLCDFSVTSRPLEVHKVTEPNFKVTKPCGMVLINLRHKSTSVSGVSGQIESTQDTYYRTFGYTL